MLEISSYVTIYCPECGDAAEDMAPEHWEQPGGIPGYRHVADRTALCPVMTRDGYRSAEESQGLGVFV